MLTKPATTATNEDLWEACATALDDVTRRLRRITAALGRSRSPMRSSADSSGYLGATREPAAVRTTKNVDLLIRRDDLPRARAAALSVEMTTSR